MATANDRKVQNSMRRQQRNGQYTTCWNPTGGVSVQIRRGLVAESEKLIIKPGMKLVWDDELNRMVWKENEVEAK